MNIVYISMLTGKKSAGLSYSIPAQVKSQSKYDNVFWYNINYTDKSKIINGDKCHSLEDYPSLKIKDLPSPFSTPDLVVFEGVYISKYLRLGNECRKSHIPYIIIPRSSLTQFAQNKKGLKKKLGNFLFFKKFIKKAVAIQYLTINELQDSTEEWNSNNLVIPNGVVQKNSIKKFGKSNGINGVFIGRPDSYQKGIDLLLDCCVTLQGKMKEVGCKINIYAPSSVNDKDDIAKMIKDRKLEGIVNKYDGIFGTEKEKVLLNSDFFVLTSRFEGHPMGLVEALSYGLPCLVTTGTNMVDEVIEYNAGWTAKIDKDSLVEAFEKLLNEREQLPQKGQNALKLSNNYNWDSLAWKSHEDYKKILGK